MAKIKSLDALLSLLNKVTDALNKFAHIFESASKKVGDHCVPLAGLAGSHPAKGEKNTQQVTISLLFLRKVAKDAEKTNLNKPIQPTSIIQPIITSTTQLQSPFLSSPPRCSPQPKGELIKKDKGKKAMSLKDTEEEGTDSESNDANLTRSRVESFKLKKLKQFDFITEKGEHIHLTADQIDVSLCGGLKVGSIRCIQGIRYGVLEFLGVGTTFDIFQNIHILYLQYGVLTSSGFGVLILFPLWSW
ncbi:hypothetical protein Tco_0673354 [Tanacetum coccineum]